MRTPLSLDHPKQPAPCGETKTQSEKLLPERLWTTAGALLGLPVCLALLGGLFAFASADAANLAPDANFRPPFFAEPATAGRNLLLPDGKFLLFSRPNTLTDRRTGAITRYLPDGTLDTAFNFSRLYKSVAAAAPGPDGKLYVAATVYLYGKKEAEEILRLNNDGAIDVSFNRTVIKSDIGATVQQIRVQPDGKILVAGFIAAPFGAGDGIFRLLPDGTMDSSFAVVQIDGFVMASVLQPDGKVLVAGNFTDVNDAVHRGIARLNSDGSLDSSFQATGFTLGNTIRALVVQDDGKIVLAGNFRFGTGPATQRAPLVRLNSDGSLDQTFTSANTITNLLTARDLVLQPDGKFVATVNASVYRFNTNGSRDNTFRQPFMVNTQLNPGGDAGSPTTLHLLSDGRLLVGGSFTDVDPAGPRTGSHFGAARLNADGTLDPSLTSSHKTGIETAPSSFARRADGSTLVGFGVKVDPAIPFNIGRLLSDGARDPDFTLSSSNPDGFLSNGFVSRGFEPLNDGSFFVFGTKNDFSFAYGKVLPTGVEAPGFGTDPVSPFQTATATPDGKVLLSAGTDPQATVYGPLERLRADGHDDDTFWADPSIRAAQVIRDQDVQQILQMFIGSRPLAVQPDGKILFLYLASDNLFHLVRLAANGIFDETFSATTLSPFDLIRDFPVIFDPLTGSTSQPPEGAWIATLPIRDACIQSDGRIVLAGQFTSFNGTPGRGLVRLEPNGTIDNTFNLGGGAQWTETTETSTFFPRVEHIEKQTDGKLLIVGTFEAFNGVPAPGIASLNPDGSVDTSFVAPAIRDKRSRIATQLERQPDGTFLLSGPYRFQNESDPTSLIRLVSPAMAVNISTRLAVGTGDNALIEGFIVQGPVARPRKFWCVRSGRPLARSA